MKKILVILLFMMFFITNINAEEQIHNLSDEYVYETPEYYFSFSFDKDHNINFTSFNSNKNISCIFNVEFYDDNDKIVYFKKYESDLFVNEKEYFIKGVDFPRKNYATKYKIETNCSDYKFESFPVNTDNYNKNDIFSISKSQAISLFFIMLFFDILTIIFIIFLLKTLIRKFRK